MQDIINIAAQITPSQNQLDWHDLEFYSFIHFGMNTFTDREWGDGTENPGLFNPTKLDAVQWATVVKNAGMKALILTCKHHDGFCLWPSKYTEHSVKNSPWKDGKGDVVREVADACKQVGIKFGVYLSPWDRNNESYGDSPKYNDYFLNQLAELLTNYGEIFCVWFDGACGEGPNGKRQEYDFSAYFDLIALLQPKAVTCVCGRDVRWCGNEAGHCRKSEWNVVPSRLRRSEYTQERSQQQDDQQFRETPIKSTDSDLGSREAIANETNLCWFPSETDTSIRPGWFYHSTEDDKVRSFDELINVYYNSVGGNSSLLLNIPPDKEGVINQHDVVRLNQIGDYLRDVFSNNLINPSNCSLTASETAPEFKVENILDGDKQTSWKPLDGTERAAVTVEFSNQLEFDHVVLQEQIRIGQRVEKFNIEYFDGKEWKLVTENTVIGYKRICKFNKIKATKIRINFLESRVSPTLSFIGVYNYDTNI